jgi:hypothetical protein
VHRLHVADVEGDVAGALDRLDHALRAGPMF